MISFRRQFMYRRFSAVLFVSALCSFRTDARASVVTFSNPSTILINDSTNPPTLATPYPSTIVVTSLAGHVITKVTITLEGLSHQFPDDIDVLLVGPQGQKAMLMANVGGSLPGYPVTNLTLTLDDDATNSLPLESPLVSGTFQPTKRLPYLLFDFPAPAPSGNSNAVAALSVFKYTEPNGTWRLFVIDDANPDSGSISTGWSMTISATPVFLSISQAGANIVLSWTNAASGYALQTTPSLSFPATWTNAVPLPTIVSGCFTVTNLASGTTRFYRLIK